MNASKACRRCSRTDVRMRPRGLCHVCYANRAVRALYPPESTKGDRGCSDTEVALAIAALPRRVRPSRGSTLAEVDAEVAARRAQPPRAP
jgi:hypothetical protein